MTKAHAALSLMALPKTLRNNISTSPAYEGTTKGS